MTNQSKPEKNSVPMRYIILAAVCVLAALCLFLAGKRVSGDMGQQSVDAIKNAVMHSAVQCYAVEGVYPETLEYLEQHYGLVINHKRYIVTYNAFASNLLPDISVLEKGSSTLR